MLDVRNAIAKILDRYSLADIVEITLRKMRRNGVASAFLPRSFRLDAVLPPETPLPCHSPRKLRIRSATLPQTIRQKQRREQKEKPNVH
jgi:Flp pilus assembly CpaF family ATPase